MLRAQADKPAHYDIHEPVVPLLVYVDVSDVTDEAAPGVEDAPLAQFALGGRGCWENSSRTSFMGPPLPRAVTAGCVDTDLLGYRNRDQSNRFLSRAAHRHNAMQVNNTETR